MRSILISGMKVIKIICLANSLNNFLFHQNYSQESMYETSVPQSSSFQITMIWKQIKVHLCTINTGMLHCWIILSLPGIFYSINYAEKIVKWILMVFPFACVAHSYFEPGAHFIVTKMSGFKTEVFLKNLCRWIFYADKMLNVHNLLSE